MTFVEARMSGSTAALLARLAEQSAVSTIDPRLPGKLQPGVGCGSRRVDAQPDK
jgi:hypothetical protein